MGTTFSSTLDFVLGCDCGGMIALTIEHAPHFYPAGVSLLGNYAIDNLESPKNGYSIRPGDGTHEGVCRLPETRPVRNRLVVTEKRRAPDGPPTIVDL